MNTIDDFIQGEMLTYQIPGLALAIIRDSEVIKLGSYGLANIEHNVPVTPQTIFQTGSIGKQFAATAIMYLMEDGKLNLDDSIRIYFPDAPEDWSAITIRHLLTHTSGIDSDYSPYDLRKDYTEDELFDIVASMPSIFLPGDKWEYNNSGYLLLGILIGRITGGHYSEFLRERIFEPLGMHTARLIGDSDIVLNRAAGYQLEQGVLKNQTWVSPTFNSTADGSLYVSITDMIQWELGLAQGTALSHESLQQMWIGTSLNDGTIAAYGLGWHISTSNGRRVVHHGGLWQGFSSHIARYIDDKLTIILFNNLANTPHLQITKNVAGICIPGQETTLSMVNPILV
jgi:CubicO group peptidase (beta-lactamase class C family)